jgi:hypothetical protein
MAAEPKRQYFIHETGEYEYPVYEVLAEQHPFGHPVDMTEREAKMHQDIHKLWREAQAELSRMYWNE